MQVIRKSKMVSFALVVVSILPILLTLIMGTAYVKSVGEKYNKFQLTKYVDMITNDGLYSQKHIVGHINDIAKMPGVLSALTNDGNQTTIKNENIRLFDNDEFFEMNGSASIIDFVIDRNNEIIYSKDSSYDGTTYKLPYANYSDGEGISIKVLAEEQCYDGNDMEYFMPIFLKGEYIGGVAVVTKFSNIARANEEFDDIDLLGHMICHTNGDVVYSDGIFENHFTSIHNDSEYIEDSDDFCNYIKQIDIEAIESAEFNARIIDTMGNVYYRKIDGTDYLLFSSIEQFGFFDYLDSYFGMLSAIAFSCILLIILFVFYMSRFYSKPLGKFINTMNKVYDGDFSVRHIEDSNNEFGYMGKVFNMVISKLQKETEIQRENAQIIEKLAFEDNLIGCRNLNKFKLDCEEVFSKLPDEGFAVVQMDINKFKLINEMFGYLEGDRILRNIASVISMKLNDNEIYARASNDNFAILFIVSDNLSIDDRINEILDECVQDPDIFGRYQLSFSVGVYVVNSISQGISSMMNKATMAQNALKSSGQSTNSIMYYDSMMRLSLIAEKDIEDRMQNALDNSEFKVYMQPKYDIINKKIVGVEALIRWISTDGTVISPDDFIPLFEKNGFVVNIDFFVLETVCKTIRGWIDSDIQPVKVSVNQSRLHLANPNYIEEVCDIIKKYDVPPEYIEFEITESAFIEDVRPLIGIMDELHSLGLNLSIDDFGSGFSSLNILKELPFDVLKIDREFLNETSDSQRSKTIVIYVVSMAKKLNIDVVCEGVETKEQADFLKLIGCYVIQGFYYSKPLPIQDFEKLAFGNVIN